MTRVEKQRQVLSGPLSRSEIEARERDGWTMVAVEWERPAAAPVPLATWREEVPFGLRVAQDCLHLETEPVELEAMLLMLELIARDHSISEVAGELTRRGFRNRGGILWTQVAVFDLLPRLIELAPRLMESEGWETRLENLQAARG